MSGESLLGFSVPPLPEGVGGRDPTIDKIYHSEDRFYPYSLHLYT